MLDSVVEKRVRAKSVRSCMREGKIVGHLLFALNDLRRCFSENTPLCSVYVCVCVCVCVCVQEGVDTARSEGPNDGKSLWGKGDIGSCACLAMENLDNTSDLRMPFWDCGVMLSRVHGLTNRSTGLRSQGPMVARCAQTCGV